MPKITVLPHPDLAPDGAVFDAPEATSLCDALLQHQIDMEHACGQVGACSTCHVIVVQGFGSLSGLGDYEEDMLDQAWGLQPQSRLACQARLSTQDVTLELPRYTLNHAREVPGS
eukprot:gene21042-25267_t